MKELLTDKNVEGYEKIVTPIKLKKKYPISEISKEIVLRARKGIQDILDKKERRIIIITGPCSIHDTTAALEYGTRLKDLSEKVTDKILIVMRTYLEKPRTSLGWEGLLYDPDLNYTYNMDKGLGLSRSLLCEITGMGIPTATEILHPSVPQYIDDLISWAAIGARTSESPTHRNMVSGLSFPVGFKNNTVGDVEVAVNAMIAAAGKHAFIGENEYGVGCKVKTKGNKYTHVVLRGGNGKSNYNSEFVDETLNLLEKKNLQRNIMIDCSHGNTNKKYTLQPKVFDEVVEQIINGKKDIIGIMLESNLYEGNQPLEDLKKLRYGVSITDSCIGWDTTEKIVLDAYKKL